MTRSTGGPDLARRIVWSVLFSLATLASGTRATDVPVVGLKLIVVDKLVASGTTKTVFVARDGGVTKGSGTDPTQIEATLDVGYGETSGAFDMPQGVNWQVNSSTLAKYVNHSAPLGGGVKTNVIKPGELVKVTAKSLGDTPLDLSQPQNGVVSVAHTVTNGAETARHCTQFVGCQHVPIAGGTGAKLKCRGNSIGDPVCTAADYPTAVDAISAGGNTCALLDTAAVRCWGGGNASLGYASINNIGDNEAPTVAGFVPVGGKVAQIDVGFTQTCTVLEVGTLRCWGSGDYGELGYGNTNDIGDDEPAGAGGDVDVGGTVVGIAAGIFKTCALLDTGAVRCWGRNDIGQLGYGNTNDIGDDETPASAGDVDVGGTVVQVASGGATCALLDTGAVRCWGFGGWLGYGNTNSIGDDETPASAGDVDVGGTAVQIAVGDEHTCALLDTGAVRCWGRGIWGKLGYGNTNNIGDNETPASAGDVDVGGTAVQVVAGREHTCALLDTGAVRCWGRNLWGQLGYGNGDNIGDDETPASAGDVLLGGTAVQIAAGSDHTCALLDTGAVRCWGRGSAGQLGYGNVNSVTDPASAGDVPVL